MSRFGRVDIFHVGPARLGEGVCWHAGRQSLWWVDILGRRVFEADLDRRHPRSFPCSQAVSAVAPERSGRLIAAAQDGIHFIDPDTGAMTPFACPPGHDPTRLRFNDAKVDPAGRFWAGTMALDGTPGAGSLYRIGGDASTTVMRSGVSISNGLAWSLDGDTLFYIDSATRSVQAFSCRDEPKALGAGRVVLEFAREDGLPDGCAMDVEGHLWIAHWGGGKVTRWDLHRRRLIDCIELPVRHVTSCAFGGQARDQLFVTTAVGDDPAGAEPEAGFVFRVDPGTAGPALAEFACA